MIILPLNLRSLISGDGFIKQLLPFLLPLVCVYPISVLMFEVHLLVEFVNMICSRFVPFGMRALMRLTEGAVQSIVSLVDLLSVSGHTSVSVLEISLSLLKTHPFILELLLVLFHFFYHAFSDFVMLLFHKQVFLVSLYVSLLWFTDLDHRFTISKTGLHCVIVFDNGEIVVSYVF